jgi:hypothetical protein
MTQPSDSVRPETLRVQIAFLNEVPHYDGCATLLVTRDPYPPCSCWVGHKVDELEAALAVESSQPPAAPAEPEHWKSHWDNLPEMADRIADDIECEGFSGVAWDEDSDGGSISKQVHTAAKEHVLRALTEALIWQKSLAAPPAASGLIRSDEKVDLIGEDGLVESVSYHDGDETALMTANLGAWYHNAVYWKHRCLKAAPPTPEAEKPAPADPSKCSCGEPFAECIGAVPDSARQAEPPKDLIDLLTEWKREDDGYCVELAERVENLLPAYAQKVKEQHERTCWCPVCGDRAEHAAQPEQPTGPKLSWAEETMLTINKLTPDVKGKAFDPDWFLLRQRFEELEAERDKLAKELVETSAVAGRYEDDIHEADERIDALAAENKALRAVLDTIAFGDRQLSATYRVIAREVLASNPEGK